MDFALQGDAIASCKCKGSKHPAAAFVPWYYWLSCHCILHGLAVTVAIRYCGYSESIALTFGIIETVVHWIIDYCKCQRWFGIHTDQGLHVLCKVLWWIMIITNTIPFAGQIP